MIELQSREVLKTFHKKNALLLFYKKLYSHKIVKILLYQKNNYAFGGVRTIESMPSTTCTKKKVNRQKIRNNLRIKVTSFDPDIKITMTANKVKSHIKIILKTFNFNHQDVLTLTKKHSHKF